MANVLTPAGGIFRRLVEPGQEVEYGQKPDVILDPSKKSILHFLKFLPTPSARRATKHIIDTLCPQLISIHALREEGDWRRKWKYGYDGIFLSTPSARRATRRKRRCPAYPRYFYPRPPQGGRRLLSGAAVVNDRISIHALREEGDKQAPETTTGGIAFLSTPSARRATRWVCALFSVAGHFYPRPPRGGRQNFFWRSWTRSMISIHALREEGDSGSTASKTTRKTFLSTPSARRATTVFFNLDEFAEISIHALREEGDGRRCVSCQPQEQISIHALREEGDKPAHNIRRHSDKHFYPRPPRGGRRLAGDALRVLGIFLSTPSARRATTRARIRRRTITNFYPRPPRGGRHKLAGMVEIEEDFYPRPPRGGRPVTGLV